MTDSVEENCPICTASGDAKEQFAVAKVAEHVREKAQRDADHTAWIDEHTENGTLAEIREALSTHGRPRN